MILIGLYSFVWEYCLEEMVVKKANNILINIPHHNRQHFNDLFTTYKGNNNVGRIQNKIYDLLLVG